VRREAKLTATHLFQPDLYRNRRYNKQGTFNPFAAQDYTSIRNPEGECSKGQVLISGQPVQPRIELMTTWFNEIVVESALNTKIYIFQNAINVDLFTQISF